MTNIDNHDANRQILDMYYSADKTSNNVGTCVMNKQRGLGSPCRQIPKVTRRERNIPQRNGGMADPDTTPISNDTNSLGWDNSLTKPDVKYPV